MKRVRPEPTAACGDLLVEIADGPMPQTTCPKSSSDPDRENPILCRLGKAVADRTAISPFRS
jgi:hypothetical protein